MKYILSLFISVVISIGAFSQNAMNVADSAGKRTLWDTVKTPNGALLLFDAPYKRAGQDSTEDLTITIAKERAHKRPAFIAIIVPNNVIHASGILMQFSKTYKDENGKPFVQMERSDPLKVPFENCDADRKTCTVRIAAGYIVDPQTDERTDIFEKFMEFDHVYFMLMYPDGSHKSVAVPLDSFKEQYKSIAAEDSPAWHE